MHCEQEITTTGQDQAKFTNEVSSNFEETSSNMTSCTFPTPASGLWSVQGDCDQTAPEKVWPDKQVLNSGNDESNQVRAKSKPLRCCVNLKQQQKQKENNVHKFISKAIFCFLFIY